MFVWNAVAAQRFQIWAPSRFQEQSVSESSSYRSAYPAGPAK